MKTHAWTLILFLAALPAAAQEPRADCKSGETFLDCANRLLDAAMATATTQAVNQKAANEKAEIAKKSVPESVPDTASSLRDFLPLFFSSLGLGNTTSDKDALTLSFNPELFDFGPANPVSMKAVVRNPVLFEALINQLPEAIRADRKSTLNDQLKDFDDVEYSFVWGRQSDRFGRAIQPHLALIADTFLAINKRAIDATTSDARKRLLNILASPDLPPEINNQPLDKMTPEVQAKVLPALDGYVRELAARQKTIRDLTSSLRFFDLADLVNNQPQVQASVNYRRRNDLVGPDEQSAKFSYEMGFANVNGLRRYCSNLKLATSDPDCLSKYLAENGTTLTGSPRLSVSAEYSKVDAYRFDLPADHFTYSLDRVTKKVGSLSLGRYLRSDDNGTQTTRLDLQADYEDVSGDPKRQSRLVAMATFTHEMSDNTATSFTVIYASKPEYLGEVDKNLSARVGLKYKIDKKKDSPAN
ncbi:MAG TPA: hypothetical protein VF173_37330 [Thermoanaerobaculia bacterium]|nr:hypothetical protein [Thermoanaerobaculia bacterium]